MSNPRYGAWAESVWQTTAARVFIKASPSLERVHFAIGTAVLIISFVLVFWVARYAAVIFPTLPPPGEEGERESGDVGGLGIPPNGGSTATGDTLAPSPSSVPRRRSSRSRLEEEPRELVT